MICQLTSFHLLLCVFISISATARIIETYFEQSVFFYNTLSACHQRAICCLHSMTQICQIGTDRTCSPEKAKDALNNFFSLRITGKGGKLRPSDRKWKIGGGDVRPSTSSGNLERWYSLQDFHLILILDMF